MCLVARRHQLLDDELIITASVSAGDCGIWLRQEPGVIISFCAALLTKSLARFGASLEGGKASEREPERESDRERSGPEREKEASFSPSPH